MRQEGNVHTESLLDALLVADTESKVDEILDQAGFLENANAWIPLGRNENNWAVAGNQQGNPVAALVEKLVNSVDAVLICEAHLRGIDPRSDRAPKTMFEAVEKFFAVKHGLLQNALPKRRSELAERIQLIVTGTKKVPCYTIVDRGEGQAPRSFHETFCALNSRNKLDIHFVQGKFHMGGTGVLPFCGRRNYQLIISRRHPHLAAGTPSDPTRTLWGITLFRRRDPDSTRRSSMYEYLAPGGEIITSMREALAALPGQYPEAYGLPITHGTVIKLYEYRFDRKALNTVATLDLYYELNRRLQQIPLPVRVSERRIGYRAHSFDTTLAGMSVRLADDRADVLEDPNTFPASGTLNIQGVGRIPLRIYAFQTGITQENRWSTSEEAVFLTINGQTHGTISQDFFRRSSVRLDYLAKDLMVVLDCSHIDGRVREDLFMTSRDRMRNIPEKNKIETELEEFLSKHQGLRELNHRRREQQLRARKEDDQPLEDIFRDLIKSSPGLAALFLPGARIPSPVDPGVSPEKYQGKRFPTFFTFEKGRPSSMAKACPVNRTVRVFCKTDAVNDYFDRDTDPGTLTISPSAVAKSIALWNGRATLVLQPPTDARVGDSFEVRLEVNDISQRRPFVLEIDLAISEEEVARPPQPHSDPKPPGGPTLGLPKIIPVRRDEWDVYKFDEFSGIELRQSGEDLRLDAFVNVDNKWLVLEKAGGRIEEAGLLEKQFMWGLVLTGMAVWHEHQNQKPRRNNGSGRADGEVLDFIRDSSRGLAMVILPTINRLAAFTPEDNRSATAGA